MPPALSNRSSAGTRARKVLCAIVVFLSLPSIGEPPSGGRAGEVSAQSLSDEILNTVKRAQKFFLGERPCGARLGLKGEAWRGLAGGIESRVLHVTPAEGKAAVVLHLVRVDPKKIAIRGLLSKDFGQKASTAADFAERSGALAVTNAGFYDKALRPLGLLVVDGKRRRSFVGLRGRPSDALYNGVFLVKGGRPAIRRNKDYRPGGEELAVQAGPLLIAEGKPAASLRGLRDSKRLDGRLILSLDGLGRLVIWVTASPLGGMNWCELRDVMLQYAGLEGGAKSRNPEIRWALNLDGGASAQLYVRKNGLKRNPPQVKGNPVPVALGFFPRK